MNLSQYLAHAKAAETTAVYPADYAQYLPLNAQRFNRVYNHFECSEAFLSFAENVKTETEWVIITEPWCGDAAQNLPVLIRLIEKIANARYTLQLRDTSSEIDSYLTNGGKAIPKVIVRNAASEDLFTWGPRPEKAQTLFWALKSGGKTMAEMHEGLHKWYADDKGASLEAELLSLIRPLL
jgi:hypothetical protein